MECKKVDYFPFYCDTEVDLYFGKSHDKYDELIPLIATDGQYSYQFMAHELKVSINAWYIKENFTCYRFAHLSGSRYIFQGSHPIDEDDPFILHAIERGIRIRNANNFRTKNEK